MSDNVKYLGDGVYAQEDGYGIWLLANDHLFPTDRIYLEPSVLRNLNAFQKEIDHEKATVSGISADGECGMG